MPLSESKLNQASISLLLTSEYNILASHIEKLPYGSANIYKVTDIYGTAFILKEMQPEMTVEKILREYSICEHVCLENVCLPKYISTRTGECFCYWKNRILVLQKYILGISLPAFSANWKSTKDLAELYAKIINSPYFISINLPHYDPYYYMPERIIHAISDHKKLLILSDCKLRNAIKKKIYWLEELLDSDLLELSKLTYANSHGDYTIFQCLYNEDRTIAAVVDFLSAKNMPIVLELVRSFAYAYENNSYAYFDVDVLCKYLKVFQAKSLIKLSFYDIKNLIYPYYLRLLYSTFCLDCSSEQCYKIASHLFSQCEFMHNNLQSINESVLNSFFK